MSESKPYASLSSGLLARKGGAKPAMRPQGFTNFGANVEDLGWNDMGGEVESFDHVPSSISALTPAPNGRSPLELTTADLVPESAPEPTVVEQQRALEESFQPAPIEVEAEVEAQAQAEVELEVEALAEPEPAPPVAIPAAVVRLPKRTALPVPASAKAKSAFTLRLDPERHLRLRLACAVSGKSAQQLVTAALDEFLSTLPEVEELAGRVPAGQRSR